MTTKETLLKNHALSEWLTSYDFDKPEEVYDAIMQCQGEEEWETVLEKYQIDIWEFVQDWDWEFLLNRIKDTYESATKLNKALNEVTA